MAAPSRTSRFNKLHKVLKKHYQAVAPDPNRSVFEQLVFACCLENAHYDRAEEAYAALEHSFFDWNEIRVTTIRELSEVMASLPDPPAAANRLKRVLQGIFESTYSFELEEFRKKNLGPAVDHLKKIDGTTNFSVAYVTQAALGGHAIPVDAGVLGTLRVVGLVSEDDVEAGVVPGLERAIAKSKGLEFASQLHQFGADFIADPCAPALHQILLEIDPEARDRLPKRRARKRSAASAGSAKSKTARKRSRRRTGDEPPRAKRKRADEKTESTEEKSAEPAATSPDQKVPEQQALAPHNEAAPPESQEAPAPKKKAAQAKKKPTAKKKTGPEKAKSRGETAPRKSPSAGLSKRKPR